MNNIIFGNYLISIKNIMQIAERHNPVSINNDPAFLANLNHAVDFLTHQLEKTGEIYGVTTGYGDSCRTPVPYSLVHELPLHLTRFHGCGMGNYFSHEQARAIMAVRLCSLSKGYSGVRLILLEQIAELLNKNISPVIPEEGSVGASGDLTPLSYLAAVLIGEREVSYHHKIRPTQEVFKSLGITPLTLMPKEALAIMNGTAVMTALACEAFQRTEYLCRLGARLTAMASLALQGNANHYDEDLFAAKPHAGQQQIARWIREDLATPASAHPRSAQIQDRYSLRCAPHIIGVVQDSLPWFKQLIENELNSANDNPLIDVKNQRILHGGHFYGGHIATVMDTMKTQVANLADLFDRQMALLVDPKFNHGLPANLSASTPERASINHGFKAVQIAMSAWTAEALKNTMPASVFSRSTECHNQDKVSLGTIAARDALRVLTLTEQVFAAHLLAVTQAICLRIKKGEIKSGFLSPAVNRMLDSVLERFTLVTEDRPLDKDLREFTQAIKQQKWELYDENS